MSSLTISRNRPEKSETSPRPLLRRMAIRRPGCRTCETSISTTRRGQPPLSSSTSLSEALLCLVWPPRPRQYQRNRFPTGALQWARRLFPRRLCRCRSLARRPVKVKSPATLSMTRILWSGRLRTFARSLHLPTASAATPRIDEPIRSTLPRALCETASTRRPRPDLGLAVSAALRLPDPGSTSRRRLLHRTHSRTTELRISSLHRLVSPSTWASHRLRVAIPLRRWPSQWTSSIASLPVTSDKASTIPASPTTLSVLTHRHVPPHRRQRLRREPLRLR